MRDSPWVYYFGDPLPAGVDDPAALLGGKGAGLRAMTDAGLPVPPGFTISTMACRRYFEMGRRWPDGLVEEVRNHLARLEAETGRTFGYGPLPLLLAVRGGGAVSMPGMLDTILNCGRSESSAQVESAAGGDANQATVAGTLRVPWPLADSAAGGDANQAPAEREDDAWQALLTSIAAVFDSWHSARAVAYRRRQGFEELPGTAVTVQAMFPSRVAGVLFTRDPLQPHAERMVLEASFGLGDSVVSGRVTPDCFVIDRRDGRVIEERTGDRDRILPVEDSPEVNPAGPTLNAERIQELCRLGVRVERHFGHPVDIEWGWAEGHFAVLQARPMNEPDSLFAPATVRQMAIQRLREAAAGSRRMWALHNLAETLPAPTPLTWDFVQQFMSGDGGFGRMYRRLGYRPSRRVRREGFLELVGGRPYADPDRLAEMFWGSLPLVYDLDALAADRSLLEGGPMHFDPDRAGPGFLFSLPAVVWSMLRVAMAVRRLRRRGDVRFEQQSLPRYLEWIAAKRGESLARRSDDELLAEIEERRRRVLDEFGPESLLPGFAGGLAFRSLQTLLVQLAGPQEGRALAATLVSPLDGDTGFEQNAMLYEVAQGRAKLEDFLQRFGHRGQHEMELAEPRWREAPGHLERLLARLRESPGPPPQELREHNLARRRLAEDGLPAQLASWGGASLREQIEFDLRQSRRLLPYRESGKHYLMMGYELIRQVIEELARRWELGGDIYFLGRGELPSFLHAPHQLRREIATRRRHWQACRQLDFPDIIDSRSLDNLVRPPEARPAATLEGLGIAPGVATGEALVVLDPAAAGTLPREYILICPSTDPGWTPLFLSARAIVMERGGMLSHGAIVARNLGIPAVVCPQAMRTIVSGDRLRVDGNQGQVRVLEKAGTEVHPVILPRGCMNHP